MEIMSGQSDSSKKRVLTRRTVEKWIKENDKELDTSIWLKFDMVPGNCEHVSTLKCGICIQFNMSG